MEDDPELEEELLLELTVAGLLWFAAAPTAPLETEELLPLVTALPLEAVGFVPEGLEEPTALLVLEVMLFLMLEVLLLLTAVVLPETVRPAASPLPDLLVEVVPDDTAEAFLPVVFLTLEPPLSDVLLENTLSDPVWYLWPLRCLLCPGPPGLSWICPGPCMCPCP